MEAGERVQQLLLRVRHDPAQVVLLRGLAPVGGVDAGQLRGGDGGRVGPLQGGGHVGGGVLRVRDPELEAAVHNWLERALGVEQVLHPRAVRRSAAAVDRRTRLGGQRALEGVGQVAADVAGRRVVLQAEQDRAVVAAQGGPGHRQHRGERDRRDALRQAAAERQLDGGRGHQLAQRHPVALAGQSLERTLHQLRHGMRGGTAVTRLVTPPAAARAGLAGADDRDLSVGDLRAGALRLRSLLGHRGCLPVTARLVRARA